MSATDETYSSSHDIPITYTLTCSPFIEFEAVPAGCTRGGVCEASGNGSIFITGKPGVVTPVYLYFPDKMPLPDSVDYLLLVGGAERKRGTLTIDQSLHRADATQLIEGILDNDDAMVKLSAGGKDISQFALSLKGRGAARWAASQLNDKLGRKKRCRRMLRARRRFFQLTSDIPMDVSTSSQLRPSPSGEIGRRGRTKICCSQERAGSSPAWGTKQLRITFALLRTSRCCARRT